MGGIKLVAVLFALTTLGTIAHADDGKNRSLKKSERTRSMHSAMSDVGAATTRQTESSTQRARRARNATVGVPRHHLLLTERRPAAKGDDAKLADVFIYNYASESLLHRVIDTATDRVIYRGTSRGEQLPLTPDESERALAALFANTDARAMIEQEFLRVTGTALGNLSDVQHKATIFVARESTRDSIRKCGSWRCAQILIYTTNDRIAIDLRPVVRLSTNRVIAVDTIQNAGHSH